MNKKSLLFLALVLAFALCFALAACGDKEGGGGDNTATTVNELTAESGVSASGTFEDGSVLKAEHHAADSEQGKAAIAAIDKPYDSAKIAIFDISVSKKGEKVQPNGKVKITMPKPFEADVYVTYHIKGDNTAEELETAIDGNNISFETTSFSYFVITTNKVMHRTKLNYKGVWAPSETGKPVDITEYFKNGHMIDKAGDSYKIADAVEADTALKLCANFDNYKYDVRAREALGFLFGQDRKFEFCAELRAGSPTGPAIAKWHGYDIYSHEWEKTYDDGKTVSWKQYYYLNFVGEVHPELEYIKFASVKNVDGYTDENGGWISEEDALDVYVVRTVVGISEGAKSHLTSAAPYGVTKIPDEATNVRTSSSPGFPRYWWYFYVEERFSTHWLLINGNVKATVFNGRGEFVQSGYNMKLKFDYDEKLDNGFSENRLNRYFILLEEDGVENPECRMDILFLQNP